MRFAAEDNPGIKNVEDQTGASDSNAKNGTWANSGARMLDVTEPVGPVVRPSTG